MAVAMLRQNPVRPTRPQREGHMRRCVTCDSGILNAGTYRCPMCLSVNRKLPKYDERYFLSNTAGAAAQETLSQLTPRNGEKIVIGHPAASTCYTEDELVEAGIVGLYAVPHLEKPEA